jgi:aspartyl-tRNA(Asn)/glutamyl-tRNA(Gln) amidotransferase subunit C
MFTKDQVLKIARLARLHISEEELEALTKDFNSILDYVQQLQKVDVSQVQPMSHVHGATNVMREDETSPSMPAAEALRNAPDTCGSFIRVPIIIE